jgi:hypothetical protein
MQTAKKTDFDFMYDETVWGAGRTLCSPDVVEKIRDADPMYGASAYLNGTADPHSLKWLQKPPKSFQAGLFPVVHDHPTRQHFARRQTGYVRFLPRYNRS